MRRPAESDSRFIVGARVAQAPNDKQALAPTLGAVLEHVSLAHVLVDGGFVSEPAVMRVEHETPGLCVSAALRREPHGRTVGAVGKARRSARARPRSTLC